MINNQRLITIINDYRLTINYYRLSINDYQPLLAIISDYCDYCAGSYSWVFAVLVQILPNSVLIYTTRNSFHYEYAPAVKEKMIVKRVILIVRL